MNTVTAITDLTLLQIEMIKTFARDPLEWMGERAALLEVPSELLPSDPSEMVVAFAGLVEKEVLVCGYLPFGEVIYRAGPRIDELKELGVVPM
jgi:hypothetical protein